MEHLASCSKPAPKCGSSPSAISEQLSGNRPSTKVLRMQAGSAEEQGKLGQCSICGCNFLCTRLEKHVSICSKIQGSRRKAFNSSKARAKGTELEKYQQLKDLGVLRASHSERTAGNRSMQFSSRPCMRPVRCHKSSARERRCLKSPHCPTSKTQITFPCPNCRCQFDPTVCL